VNGSDLAVECDLPPVSSILAPGVAKALLRIIQTAISGHERAPNASKDPEGPAGSESPSPPGGGFSLVSRGGAVCR
jgi:hypothetical protein